MIEVRLATTSDAAKIAEVQVNTWRAAYTFLPEAAFADMTKEKRTARWQNILSGEHQTSVALTNSDVVGFASVGPCRDEGIESPELYALYILPDYWGLGFADQLVDSCLPVEEEIYLWVFADNARAIAFYTKQGFALDGSEEPIAFGGLEFLKRRMLRPTKR